MINLTHLPVISALVSNMDEGFVVRNAKGEVVYANPVGHRCLDKSIEIKKTLITEVSVAGETFRSTLFIV